MNKLIELINNDILEIFNQSEPMGKILYYVFIAV